MSEHLLPLTHEQDPEILKFLGYGQEKKSSDAVTRSLGCTLRSCPWKSQTGSGTRNNPGWECGHCRYVPSSPYSHSPSTVLCSDWVAGKFAWTSLKPPKNPSPQPPQTTPIPGFLLQQLVYNRPLQMNYYNGGFEHGTLCSVLSMKVN